MSAAEIVVQGNPTDEELAAVLVVLGAVSTDAAPPSGPATPSATSSPGNGWSAYWRLIKAPPSPGPGAWRSSGRMG